MSLEAKIDALTEVMTRVAANQEEILKMARAGSDKAAPAEEEAPRSRRRAAEAQEEDAPRSRSRSRDKEAEKPAEEDAPRSRRRGRDKEDEKPADKEEAAPRRRRASADKEDEAPKFKRPAEGKAKLDDIRAAFAFFLNTKDKDVEKERRAHIDAILDFLNIEKTAEMDPRDFDEVLDWIEQFLDGTFKDFPEN